MHSMGTSVQHRAEARTGSSPWQLRACSSGWRTARRAGRSESPRARTCCKDAARPAHRLERRRSNKRTSTVTIKALHRLCVTQGRAQTSQWVVMQVVLTHANLAAAGPLSRFLTVILPGSPGYALSIHLDNGHMYGKMTAGEGNREYGGLRPRGLAWV